MGRDLRGSGLLHAGRLCNPGKRHGTKQKRDQRNHEKLHRHVFRCASAWVAFKAVSVLIDLRVSTTDEQRGLDFSEHHEVGYPEFQATLHN